MNLISWVEIFTIELASLLKREGFELEEMEKVIKKAIEGEICKLMDYPNGIIHVTIGKESWLVQKETLICKQPQIIEF